MDGYETTLEIREMIKMKKIKDVVIVGITAYVSEDMVSRCYESGMDEVLNKPLSKEMTINDHVTCAMRPCTIFALPPSGKLVMLDAMSF